MTKKKELDLSIFIAAKFGTPFQEKTALEALELMIKAWAMYWDTSHKNNYIDYRININNSERQL